MKTNLLFKSGAITLIVLMATTAFYKEGLAPVHLVYGLPKLLDCQPIKR